MKTALLVGLGSFIGGSGRYLVSKILQQNIVNSFPYGTLTVNVVGCFLIGVVYGWSSKNPLDATWQLFLTTGILGGFTTFSAFSMEAINLMKSGNLYGAILYIFLSVLVGLMATAIGYWIARIY
jgi:fluoride exporter